MATYNIKRKDGTTRTRTGGMTGADVQALAGQPGFDYQQLLGRDVNPGTTPQGSFNSLYLNQNLAPGVVPAGGTSGRTGNLYNISPTETRQPNGFAEYFQQISGQMGIPQIAAQSRDILMQNANIQGQEENMRSQRLTAALNQELERLKQSTNATTQGIRSASEATIKKGQESYADQIEKQLGLFGRTGSVESSAATETLTRQARGFSEGERDIRVQADMRIAEINASAQEQTQRILNDLTMSEQEKAIALRKIEQSVNEAQIGINQQAQEAALGAGNLAANLYGQQSQREIGLAGLALDQQRLEQQGQQFQQEFQLRGMEFEQGRDEFNKRYDLDLNSEQFRQLMSGKEFDEGTRQFDLNYELQREQNQIARYNASTSRMGLDTWGDEGEMDDIKAMLAERYGTGGQQVNNQDDAQRQVLLKSLVQRYQTILGRAPTKDELQKGLALLESQGGQYLNNPGSRGQSIGSLNDFAYLLGQQTGSTLSRYF